MNSLILIDGYGLLFRSYFGSDKKNLKNKKGIPVGGIYVFIQQLKWIIDNFTNIDKLGYSHIGITFDTGKKTFRSEIYKEYKKNRPPVPQDLIYQFSLAREVADVLNIKRLEFDGYEADDLIATYSKKAEKENFKICIISSDKDLMQLINENIYVYDAKNKIKIHEKQVKEKFGVLPSQLLDFLTLKGDSSDNVPGAKGIGDKIASELLNEFQSIDNIFKNIDKIKKDKIKKLLKDSIENIELSKKLISLNYNVPLNVSLDDLKRRPYDINILDNFYKEQDFESLRERNKIEKQGYLF